MQKVDLDERNYWVWFALRKNSHRPVDELQLARHLKDLLLRREESGESKGPTLKFNVQTACPIEKWEAEEWRFCETQIEAPVAVAIHQEPFILSTICTLENSSLSPPMGQKSLPPRPDSSLKAISPKIKVEVRIAFDWRPIHSIRYGAELRLEKLRQRQRIESEPDDVKQARRKRCRLEWLETELFHGRWHGDLENVNLEDEIDPSTRQR